MDVNDHIEESKEDKACKKKGNRPMITGIIIIAFIIGGFFGTRWLIHRFNYTSSDDAQVNADLISLSFKVPGRIREIFVSGGDEVKAGQKIAELDPADYRIALEKVEASLEVTRKDLAIAESSLELTRTRTEIGVLQSSSSLDQVEGSVSISSTQQDINLVRLQNDADRAEINMERAEDMLDEVRPLEEQARADRDRAENLYASGVISKEQWEQASTQAEVMKGRLSQAEQGLADAAKQLETAKANLQSAGIDKTRVDIAQQDREKASLSLTLSKEQQQEEVRMAELNVESLSAKLAELEAQVEQAQASLAEAVIYSPVDGIVARNFSLAGEFVSPGKPVSFVVDTSSIWVSANIVEKKLGNFKVGSKARITVDAIPGVAFDGEVDSIGAATNAKFALIPQSNPTGQFIKVAQRVPVKIIFSGDVSQLKPGMSAVVSIKNER